ncbi:MAG: ABC transporter substrate-binding protein [Thermodesulfobacteriota bacterium]
MRIRKKTFMMVAGILFFMLPLTIFPEKGTTAPAEKTVTGKEWAQKIGLDWGPKYWPSKPVRGGVLQASWPQYIGLMNPNHWPVNDWQTMAIIFDRIVYTDGSYRATIPWLAESWSFPDKLTCIMKLRRGVQFHDGSDFNAESLKYQMEWIKNPANGAWSRALLDPLESIEVLDNYTVKWHFKKPWASFLGTMASVPGYPLSAKALKADVALRESRTLARQLEREKEQVKKAEKEASEAAGDSAAKANTNLERARKKLAEVEEKYKKAAVLAEGVKEFDNHPVGSGPFMLEEGSPGNYVKLKRNPNWWLAKFIGMPNMPYFDGVKVSVIPDPSVRLANLRAGKLDFVMLEPNEYPMVKNDRNLQINIYPVNHLVGMRFNTTGGPCKDIRVRKAVSHALDRKALIAGVDFGLGRPASAMFPDDHWCHNPNLKPVKYDPALSKKLLKEAGYKNGLTLRGYMLNTATSQTLAEAVKEMLAKVGIVWKVDLLDAAAISERLRKVDYDFAGGGAVWIYDPDILATNFYHPDGGFNYGRSNNPKAIALVEAGRTEMNEAKRAKIYHELEKVIYDNYEDVFLWYPMAIRVYAKKVQGWNNPMYIRSREGQIWSHPLWFKSGK